MSARIKLYAALFCEKIESVRVPTRSAMSSDDESEDPCVVEEAFGGNVGGDEDGNDEGGGDGNNNRDNADNAAHDTPLLYKYVPDGELFAPLLTLRSEKITKKYTDNYGLGVISDTLAIKHSWTRLDAYSIQALLLQRNRTTFLVHIYPSENGALEFSSHMLPPLRTIHYTIAIPNDAHWVYQGWEGEHYQSDRAVAKLRQLLRNILTHYNHVADVKNKCIYLIKIVDGVVTPFNSDDEPIFRYSIINIPEIYKSRDSDPFAPK